MTARWSDVKYRKELIPDSDVVDLRALSGILASSLGPSSSWRFS